MTRVVGFLLALLMALTVIVPAALAYDVDDCACGGGGWELKNGVWRPAGSGAGGGAGVGAGAAISKGIDTIKKVDSVAEIGWKWFKRAVIWEAGRRLADKVLGEPKANANPREPRIAPDFERV